MHIYNTQASIKQSLINRFKEFRRNPKEKESSAEGKQEQPKEKPKYPGIDFIMKPPSVPPEEDQTSFERHNKVLLLENKKAHPNMVVVTTLMEWTFPFRRKDILAMPYDIASIFVKYPFLQNIEQVCDLIF